MGENGGRSEVRGNTLTDSSKCCWLFAKLVFQVHTFFFNYTERTDRDDRASRRLFNKWFKPSSRSVKVSIKCLPVACLRAAEPPGVVFGLFQKLPV